MSQNPLYDPKVPDLAYKDKLDASNLFFRQVERCLQAAGTEYFGNTVMALAGLLPAASYLNVMSRQEEWTPEKITPKFLFNCGQRVGSLEKPKMRKIPGTYGDEYPVPYVKNVNGEQEIDWGSPTILSPIMVTEIVPDYSVMFRCVIEEAEAIKILWTEGGGGVVNLLKSVALLQKTGKKAPRVPEYKRRRPRSA
jgi:hypothetical protein